MPTDRFSDTVQLAAPPAAVYAHLVDPRSYVGLSPLVVAVRDIRADSYIAVERFRFGPFHWDNNIRVTLTGAEDGGQITSAVVSPGGVRLTATIDLAPTGTGTGIGTTVTETIEVSSPALLRSFVRKQASSVQRARLAELSRRFAQ